MLPPIFQLMKGSGAVTAIVGATPPRVYRHADAPEDTSKPYITWFVVTDSPENNLSSLPPVDRVSIQIDCWSLDDAEIEALATAVRDTMEPVAHMTGVIIDNKESETLLYHKALGFDYWLDR